MVNGRPHTRAELTRALRLYLVTDGALCRGRSLLDVVGAAVRGGAGCVQLREKALDTREYVARAVALKALLAPLGVPLVINDRIDVALACDADGVHLGQRDMAVEMARRLLPVEVFIGWSVETPDDVARSAALPVDYLGVSPVYTTPTKIDTAAAWGLDGLRAVRAATRLPLVAIGGITTANVGAVFDAGADGVAVVSALCGADDPEAAAAAFIARIEASGATRQERSDG